MSWVNVDGCYFPVMDTPRTISVNVAPCSHDGDAVLYRHLPHLYCIACGNNGSVFLRNVVTGGRNRLVCVRCTHILEVRGDHNDLGNYSPKYTNTSLPSEIDSVRGYMKTIKDGSND